MENEPTCSCKSTGQLYCFVHGPCRKEPKVDVEQLARECYLRLCPYAPKDLPVEKSTTMRAFLEGYKAAKNES